MTSCMQIRRFLLGGLLLSSSVYAVANADQAALQKGAYLAKVSDCVSCHSAPHGKDFAGGLQMMTPLGTIYTTNITPDPETGIGNYSLADFTKVMRKGVAKDGHHLYPAMPYPSYTKMSDEDISLLYVYFMKGIYPVKQANKKNGISWPLNARWPLAAWNFVFLKEGVYQPKAEKDANWNRGAYLVQGMGHCGACHTPRGIAFQEKGLDESSKTFMTGATLEGWAASNLAGDYNSGLGRWSEGDIASYLKTGVNQYSSAFGTMTTVINNSTEAMSAEDLSAIAHYLKTLPPAVTEKQSPYQYNSDTTLAKFKEPTKYPGARLYQQYCLACHGADGKGTVPYLTSLAGNPAIMDADPSSLINVVLNGSPQLVPQGIAAPYNMPRFRSILNDDQVAQLVTFMQTSWNHNLSSTEAKQVAKIRKLPPSAH